MDWDRSRTRISARTMKKNQGHNTVNKLRGQFHWHCFTNPMYNRGKKKTKSISSNNGLRKIKVTKNPASFWVPIFSRTSYNQRRSGGYIFWNLLKDYRIYPLFFIYTIVHTYSLFREYIYFFDCITVYNFWYQSGYRYFFPRVRVGFRIDLIFSKNNTMYQCCQ